MWQQHFASVVNVLLVLGAGPGRELLVDGWRAWRRGAPDMSTLVGLGASASFGVSCIAAGLPALGWKTFFEEPAMLLGFVLVGRALEERAKVQASADMAALQVPSLCSSQALRALSPVCVWYTMVSTRRQWIVQLVAHPAYLCTAFSLLPRALHFPRSSAVTI